MTPKPANSGQKPSPVSRSEVSAQAAQLSLVADNASREQSVFKTPLAEGANFSEATRLHGRVIEGTIGAAAASVDEQSYGSGSDALLSGAPLHRARHREAAPAPRVRANDLVAELREISGQVNRMMAQVDRAIHRLGEHAGEPLRR